MSSFRMRHPLEIDWDALARRRAWDAAPVSLRGQKPIRCAVCNGKNLTAPPGTILPLCPRHLRSITTGTLIPAPPLAEMTDTQFRRYWRGLVADVSIALLVGVLGTAGVLTLSHALAAWLVRR